MTWRSLTFGANLRAPAAMVAMVGFPGMRFQEDERCPPAVLDRWTNLQAPLLPACFRRDCTVLCLHGYGPVMRPGTRFQFRYRARRQIPVPSLQGLGRRSLLPREKLVHIPAQKYFLCQNPFPRKYCRWAFRWVPSRNPGRFVHALKKCFNITRDIRRKAHGNKGLSGSSGP